jgi:hypothetical protein
MTNDKDHDHIKTEAARIAIDLCHAFEMELRKLDHNQGAIMCHVMALIILGMYTVHFGNNKSALKRILRELTDQVHAAMFTSIDEVMEEINKARKECV